jgi:hypothetical protein
MYDWQKLDAGSDLNRMVAERIGGRVRHGDGSPDGIYFQLKIGNTWYGRRYVIGERTKSDPPNTSHMPMEDIEMAERWAWADCPEFSTSLAAAFELVDEVNDCDFMLRLVDPHTWACEFPGAERQHGNTPELAICRARLALAEKESFR